MEQDMLGGGGGHLTEVWVVECCLGLQILAVLMAKTVHLATLLKTRPFK